jgi:branched-chain amino acid transport system ATP-binding protein
MKLLAINAVSKNFGGLQALHEISFHVNSGEVLGMIGANGAGKTTLLSLIAGHERPSSGEILFRGEPIVGLRPDQLARRGIARTFQNVRPFPGMTVLDNVLVPIFFGAGRQHNRSVAKELAIEILTEVELQDRRDRLASSLTLSDQKRLEIARALGTQPILIMLDEVMAGLTGTEVNRLLQSIQVVQRRRSLTIVFVEHVMQAVMRLSDRVVVLHHGRLITTGSPGSVGKDPRVIEAYLGPSDD